MEPITATILATAVMPLVNGVAGEAGKQAWRSLVDLVRRTFDRDSEAVHAVAELEASPSDASRVQMTAETLVVAAERDSAFAGALRSWVDEAQALCPPDNRVTNVIAGDAQVQGNVVQGRDFSGPITFG